MDFFVFIYASNCMEERKEIWVYLKNHYNSPMIRNKPWVNFRDFIELLDVEEHSEFFHSSPDYGIRDF